MIDVRYPNFVPRAEQLAKWPDIGGYWFLALSPNYNDGDWMDIAGTNSGVMETEIPYDSGSNTYQGTFSMAFMKGHGGTDVWQYLFLHASS